MGALAFLSSIDMPQIPEGFLPRSTDTSSTEPFAQAKWSGVESASPATALMSEKVGADSGVSKVFAGYSGVTQWRKATQRMRPHRKTSAMSHMHELKLRLGEK